MSYTFKFPRSTPEEQGISSAGIQAFLEAFEKEAASKHDMEMHSFMLVRHGHVVADGWWSPNAPYYRHMLYSLSKSFTSTAVGFAVSEGLLSVDDFVVSFFTENLPMEVSENLAAMRVRHLLSMSTGHAGDTMEPIFKQPEGNWIKGFLGIPVEYAPGTHFLYNTGASYMLSAIIQKVTGSKLIDYLKPRLFEPLGIDNPTWEVCLRGINTGGFGLSVKTEDIAKFGQLYLQKGLWEGRQLLTQAWVEEATRKQITNGSELETASDWEQGYGYQFWRCRHGAYRGDGAFGQYCFVLPEQDAVLAITSAVSDMSRVFELTWKHLLPAMQTDRLPENKTAHTALLEKLKSLQLAVPQGNASSAAAELVSGKSYILKSNVTGFDRIYFEFDKEKCMVKAYRNNNELSLVCGIGKWVEGRIEETSLLPPFANTSTIFTAGTWIGENTFKIIMRFVETPHYNIITCLFDKDELRMDFAINLTMFPFEVQAVNGILEK